jgi:hypothetical protein
MQQTTFALDELTAGRLERLSARWQVPPVEVIRRAVAQVDTTVNPGPVNPAALLRQLHQKGGGLDRGEAEAYLAEVHQDRKHWRGR